MVVLRAIGSFFVKIGRWIKETAWIQPLLIVGGIFAIIFSIPYISNWVSSWFDDSNAATNFYEKYKVSLDGAEKGESDADADVNGMGVIRIGAETGFHGRVSVIIWIVGDALCYAVDDSNNVGDVRISVSVHISSFVDVSSGYHADNRHHVGYVRCAVIVNV